MRKGTVPGCAFGGVAPAGVLRRGMRGRVSASKKSIRTRTPYKPMALHHLLKEIERELRQHRRTDAALLVRLAAMAVARDQNAEVPPHLRLLM